MRPVGTLVNDVTNEGPELVDPAPDTADEDGQLELPW